MATTRARDPRPGTLFGGDRATGIDHARITVSIPPNHVEGKIEWPKHTPPDPQTEFVTRDAAYLDSEKAFIDDLNKALAGKPRGQRKVTVFVHKYNTLFAEGLYLLAQVAEDAQMPAVPVYFSWASRGRLTDYVYDNNSATAARDALEHTLRAIAASDADEINVLAHSMGNWVTVEAIRQIKISNIPFPLAKVGTIILAAPDIDIDVFKSQMARIGKPRKPFLIVVSGDDKALLASRFIAGDKPRLGADGNAAELTALGAIVIDLSDVKGQDSLDHGKFAQVAEIGPKLRALLAKGIAIRPSAPGGTEAVANGVDAVAALPLAIIGTPIKIITGN